MLLLITVLGFQRLAAQTDTLSQYRDFLTLCTAYQQAPLQLNLNYKADNNLVINPYDTMSMQGYFYVGGNGVYYLHMGDVEQYIDDSIALMINHSFRQVMVNNNIAGARKLLDRYLGAVTNDSSVQSLINAYAIAPVHSGNNAYLLTSRTSLPGTAIVRQSINLRYDPVKRQPVEIVTTRRSLVAIDPADSLAFTQKFAGQNVLVSLPGIGFYFVRTYTTIFSYKDIKHEDTVSMPMQVTDYITRNAGGEYELVPAKSTYRLSVE